MNIVQFIPTVVYLIIGTWVGFMLNRVMKQQNRLIKQQAERIRELEKICVCYDELTGRLTREKKKLLMKMEKLFLEVKNAFDQLKASRRNS